MNLSLSQLEELTKEVSSNNEIRQRNVEQKIEQAM